VHDGKSITHLLLTNAGRFLLADGPEDVGQGFVHPRHVLVVQVVNVDGFLSVSFILPCSIVRNGKRLVMCKPNEFYVGQNCDKLGQQFLPGRYQLLHAFQALS